MRSPWFKSTFSGGDQTCVEISHRASTVLIRDSKYTGLPEQQPIITVTDALWADFLGLVLSTTSGTLGDSLAITAHADGAATISDNTGVRLDYNRDEWEAFTKGVANGQFDRP